MSLIRTSVAALGVLAIAGGAVALLDPPGDTSQAPATISTAPPAPDSTGQSVVQPVATPAGRVGGHNEGARPPVAQSVPTASLQEAPAITPGLKVVRVADLAVDIDEGSLARSMDAVAAVADDVGGYVASSSSQEDPDGQTTTGRAVLRVPESRFEEARARIAGLGSVARQAIQGHDVGAAAVDFDARLRTLGAEEEALRALMAQAASTDEVLRVQTSLFDVRQRAERLEAERSNLQQATELSVITVELREPVVPVTSSSPSLLGRRTAQAASAALAVVGGMMVVAGWLLPFAAAGAVATLAWRARRRLAV